MYFHPFCINYHIIVTIYMKRMCSAQTAVHMLYIWSCTSWHISNIYQLELSGQNYLWAIKAGKRQVSYPKWRPVKSCCSTMEVCVLHTPQEGCFWIFPDSSKLHLGVKEDFFSLGATYGIIRIALLSTFPADLWLQRPQKQNVLFVHLEVGDVVGQQESLSCL